METFEMMGKMMDGGIEIIASKWYIAWPLGIVFTIFILRIVTIQIRGGWKD